MAASEVVRTQKVKPFGWGDRIGYMLGDFGCNMSFALISGFMFIFFTQFIGISLYHYSLVILVTKIWDGINDPIVGALVDRIKPKDNSKFKPWIKWGSVALVFSSAIMFINTSLWSDDLYWLKLVIMTAGYLIWDVAYTVVNVPYGSMNATITSNPVYRSQLSTFRTIGALIANIAIGVALPQLLYRTEIVAGVEKSIFQGQSMFIIAVVMGLIALASFQLLNVLVTERVKAVEQADVKFNFFKTLKTFFSFRSTIGLTILNLVTYIFLFSTQLTNPLVYQMYFGEGRLSSLGAISYLVPIILIAPLLSMLVKKFGKKAVSYYPFYAALVLYIILLVVPIANPYVWIVLSTLIGICTMFFGMLGWAMISDGIDDLELRTGRREEGTVYAMVSLIRKISQGVQSALIPFLIATFIPGLVMDDAATWTTEYGLQIKNLSVILPLVGVIITILTFAFIYDLDKQRVKEIEVQLGRAEAEAE
ncbi:MAG: glycoside-pentoside-hexuronide (GPH):cation symporter [Anaerolineae bacterium]|jgi:GPH family glycoside/pentoside/hexuronide:cation symporter|nr:glycoside-pentoside-hexuronide (GPH):cation symporter [Anaerolineae bacterium]